MLHIEIETVWWARVADWSGHSLSTPVNPALQKIEEKKAPATPPTI